MCSYSYKMVDMNTWFDDVRIHTTHRSIDPGYTATKQQPQRPLPRQVLPASHDHSRSKQLQSFRSCAVSPRSQVVDQREVNTRLSVCSCSLFPPPFYNTSLTHVCGCARTAHSRTSVHQITQCDRLLAHVKATKLLQVLP